MQSSPLRPVFVATATVLLIALTVIGCRKDIQEARTPTTPAPVAANR